MRVPKRLFKRAALFAAPLSALLTLGLVQPMAAPAQTQPPPKQKDMGLAALVRALTTPPPPPAPATPAPAAPAPVAPAPAAPAPAPAPAAAAAPAMPSSNADLEQRLTALKFDVGIPDGVLDEATSHGILAFQKTYDMPRTGQIDQAVLTKVGENPPAPAPIIPAGEPDRVEIDLNRQVLYFYRGGALDKVLPVSTGNGERFCSEGYCRNAVTPTGAFRVYRENDGGWESGPLGDLYKPQYFEGGVALHGAKSVPASPASHGCVRIPMHSADWFAVGVTAGTPVYVAG